MNERAVPWLRWLLTACHGGDAGSIPDLCGVVDKVTLAGLFSKYFGFLLSTPSHTSFKLINLSPNDCV
jgi:hypothetical protein